MTNKAIDGAGEIKASRAATSLTGWKQSAIKLLEAYATGALDFEGAKLAGANLSGAKLVGANLSGANLSGANLWIANLWIANLLGANLSGAKLVGAKLAGANLSGAKLVGANLSGANLSGANLSGANLSGMKMTAANLRGADLTGARNIASVSGVGIDGRTIYAVTHTGGPMFHIGCFWGGYEAATAAVTKKYSAPEYSRHLKSYLLALDTLAALLEAQNDGGE